MSGFSFGNTQQQPGGGFSFGATNTGAAAPAPAFGSAAPSFGTAAAPAFGATTSAAPTFGATTTPTFGATQTLGTPAFGGTAQPAFGATAQQAAPAFGAGAQQPAPAFGATATPQAFGTGLPTFGAPASSAPSFGTQTSAAPTFGTGTLTAPAFGATATAAPAFGAAPASSAATAPTASFSFGAPTASTAAPTSAPPTLSFGASLTGAPAGAATSAAPTLGLGLGGTGAFSFAKPAATTSASLNFGTTTTSVAPFSATGGSGAWKPIATTTAAATAPTPFLGLGGVDVSSTQPKAGDAKQDSVKVKETQVPDEIAKTVDALKSYIKAQKTLSSDIGRTSTSKLTNVSSEIMNLQWALQEVSNSVDANYKQIKLLRKETTKTIQSVEMAQRTQDTPAGLQFENTAPFQFFQNLVTKYEQDLINFRQQIALTEHHMRSLTNPQTVAPEDIKRGFQQINESFISLAGRLHELHQKVEAQKEQFLNLRKYRLRDATNVFAPLENPETKVDTTRITCGPTPFSNISAMSAFGKSFSNASATAAAGGPGSSTVPGTK